MAGSKTSQTAKTRERAIRVYAGKLATTSATRTVASFRVSLIAALLGSSH
jgi:hypothetical protein